MQRALIIGSIVIVILGLGVAGYFYFFSSTNNTLVATTPNIKLPSSGDAIEKTGDEIVGRESETEADVVGVRLVKIDSGVVVPNIAITSEVTASTTSTGVWFIDRESGNIFVYNPDTKKITRTSNRTIPGIQEASWASDASFVVARYLSGDDLSTINSYVLYSNGEEGVFLQQNLVQIIVGLKKILTVASGVNGTIATNINLDGSVISDAFSTPLSQIRLSSLGNGSYVAFSNPSNSEDGYAFLVNNSGEFSRIIGPKEGLVALASPEGTYSLVSFIEGGTMRTVLVNIKTLDVINLPLETIVDKCTWVKDGTAVYCGVPINFPKNKDYVSDWYQGALSFTDRIWKIDVSGRFTQLILNFSEETNEDLDISSIAVDDGKNILVFTNKRDGSLWAYSL